MEIIENSLGWENEFGEQLAYKEEFSMLNTFRHPKFRTPIWKSVEKDSQSNVKEKKA